VFLKEGKKLGHHLGFFAVEISLSPTLLLPASENLDSIFPKSAELGKLLVKFPRHSSLLDHRRLDQFTGFNRCVAFSLYEQAIQWPCTIGKPLEVRTHQLSLRKP